MEGAGEKRKEEPLQRALQLTFAAAAAAAAVPFAAAPWPAAPAQPCAAPPLPAAAPAPPAGGQHHVRQQQRHHLHLARSAVQHGPALGAAHRLGAAMWGAACFFRPLGRTVEDLRAAQLLLRASVGCGCGGGWEGCHCCWCWPGSPGRLSPAACAGVQ
eukprot:1159131-Pelagomonas_calceolata.AAC.6